MGILSRLQVIEEKDKSHAVRKLVEDSTPDFDFYLMVILSILMATFGLLAGSETIVIGSMLIAPLLHPVLGLSLGVSMSNHELIRRSLRTIGMAIIFAIIASIVATFLFSFGHFSEVINGTILSRTVPSLIYLIVAVISGFAVTYALVKPELSETLPGVAVSVALIPPLAVIGIGVAKFDPTIVAGAVVMFGVNILGILAASMFAFSIMNVHSKEKIAQTTIKKEEKRIEMEEQEVKKIENSKE
jgi:uncharacterized hydrophobic protein (TIGR00271 family)